MAVFLKIAKIGIYYNRYVIGVKFVTVTLKNNLTAFFFILSLVES